MKNLKNTDKIVLYLVKVQREGRDTTILSCNFRESDTSLELVHEIVVKFQRYAFTECFFPN